MVLLGLLAVVYAVTRRTLLVQFSELEKEQTRQNLDRVSNAISNELDLLNGTARDDSMWDEAYDFVQHPRPDWGEKNFGDGTYKHLRLNLLVYFNAAGEPVFAREFETGTGRLKTARPELVGALSQLIRSRTDSSSEEGTSGILELPQGCLLVAAWPVVSSVGHVPPKGTLIMARWLNEGELRRLGWTQNLQFDVFPTRNPGGEQDHFALTQLSGTATVFVAPLSQNQIAGYALLSDIHGEKDILLRVVMARSIHQQGRTTLTFLMLATLIVGLV